MRQKIKGACWNTTATTAEQSTIFSKGIKMMKFSSGFSFSSTNYNYWGTGLGPLKNRSVLKLNLLTKPCIPRLVCWSLATWMTPFPLPWLTREWRLHWTISKSENPNVAKIIHNEYNMQLWMNLWIIQWSNALKLQHQHSPMHRSFSSTQLSPLSSLLASPGAKM